MALMATQPSLISLALFLWSQDSKGSVISGVDGVLLGDSASHSLIDVLQKTVLDFVLLDIAFRSALVASLVSHEWAHLLAAVSLQGMPVDTNVFTQENIMGGLSMQQWRSFMTPLSFVEVCRYVGPYYRSTSF